MALFSKPTYLMNEQPIEPTHTTKSNPLQTLAVPVAIVIAGALIAGGLYFGLGNKANSPMAIAPAPTPTAPDAPNLATLDQVRPVSGADHIKGSLDAPVKIVEYSDFECPFCKRMHETMNSVMKTYADTGKVAWVYRQFPLEQLHPVKAQAAAVASECAADQGGNDAFWKFTDRYFELTLTNNRTDIETVIPQIAQEIGLNKATFKACRTSGKFDAKIAADVENAIATGGRGTPWSIAILPDGTKLPINGALPEAVIVQIIEQGLTQQ